MSVDTDHAWKIHIRSKDCIKRTSGFTTDLLINMKAYIPITGDDSDFHIKVSSAEIPFNWYSFSSQLENINIYIDGGVSFVLTEGSYDVYEMIELLTDDLTFPYSCSYNDNTSKITLTNTDATQHILNFSNLTSQGLSKALGFDITADITIGISGSYTAPNCINFTTIHSVFVHSDRLSSSNVLSTKNFNYDYGIIEKIPINARPFGVINFRANKNQNPSIIKGVSSIQVFDIQLRDQNDKLINLNGSNWEISLLIESHSSNVIVSDGITTHMENKELTYEQQFLPNQSLEEEELIEIEDNSRDYELDDLLLRLKLNSLK